MTIHEYQVLALRTAGVADRTHDLMHAVLGIVTEVGELADVVKKRHAYGKEIDWVNLMEETGDVLWYLALMARALQVDLDAIAQRNIAKLATRYPDKFNQAAALERNLEAERKTLEATLGVHHVTPPYKAPPAGIRETQEEAAYFPKLKALPSASEQIRYLCGSTEDGTDRTLRFWQDDENRQYFVMVDDRKYSSYCLEKALAIAVAEERKVKP